MKIVKEEPDFGFGMKFDDGKAQMDLIPRHALEEMARVLGYGAQKYGKGNFKKGLEYSRLIAACLRHLHAFNDGEDTDPETGMSHVAHAATNLVMLMWMERYNKDFDDRT